MGSSFSSSSGVLIWCHKPFYFGGETVEGYVCLNLSTGLGASTVNVELVGREEAYWDEVVNDRRYSNEEWKDDPRTYTRQASREFIKVCVPVYSFPGQSAQAGQYQFPFRFTLPDGLPGTFSYRDSYASRGSYTYQNLTAAVSYKLVAEVLPPGSTRAAVRGSTELTVRQRLTRAPAELCAAQSTSVSTCCCFGQGQVEVRVRLEKDAIAAGETAHVVLEVNNGTQLAFPHAKAVVQRKVALVASSSNYDADDDVFEVQLPGLPAGTSYLGQGAQRLDVPLPASLLPTTQGNLVRCTYQLIVSLSAGTFTNTVRLAVPLTVYVPPPASYVPYGAAPPDFWKPAVVVGVPVDIPVPSAPPLMMAPPTMAPPYAGPAPGYAPPNPVHEGKPQ